MLAPFLYSIWLTSLSASCGYFTFFCLFWTIKVILCCLSLLLSLSWNCLSYTFSACSMFLCCKQFFWCNDSVIWVELSLCVSLCVLNRPTFQLFSWHTCLLGILSCLVMMFVINPVYSSGSIVLLLLLLLFLHYRSPTSSWGYISQALIFHQVSGLCRDAFTQSDIQFVNRIVFLLA